MNAHPRYAGKLDDLQGGESVDTTMLMQQVREVMMVNQEMTDESSWIWLTWVSVAVRISQISFETQKGNSMMRSSKMRLKG